MNNSSIPPEIRFIHQLADQLSIAINQIDALQEQTIGRTEIDTIFICLKQMQKIFENRKREIDGSEAST